MVGDFHSGKMTADDFQPAVREFLLEQARGINAMPSPSTAAWATMVEF